MPTTGEALTQALHYYQQGAWQAADQLCRQVLEAEPHHAEAHYYLGMIAYRSGRPDVAVEHLGQAVLLQPGTAAIHCHLGLAYRALGRLDDAVACYQQALALQPNFAEAHNNLGLACRQLGRQREATACFEQAVRCQPDFAGTHNNLGVAYQDEGRLDEAADCFRHAVRLLPQFAEAYVNLGGVLQKQGKLDEAVASFQQAVFGRPDYALAHSDLGVALYRLGRMKEALSSFQHALRFNPSFPDAHTNLGGVLLAQGKPEEALACFQQALWHRPDFAEAHRARAYVWLQAGDFERGWPEYEWRCRCPGFAMPPLTCPRPAWDGSPLEGRTILLRAEQGLGDTLQFIRYVPLVAQRGGRVIVEAHARLVPLLRTCSGVDQVIAREEDPPPFDVHALLLSLPGLLGTTLAAVPADVPYLAVDPALVARWRQELDVVPGFKVGIVWQGNPMLQLDRLRSVPLTAFAPLAGVEGVNLVSLQVGPGCEQVAALGGRFPVADLASGFDPAGIGDAAAVVQNLDLVITVDTSVAHLAGALSVPVWLALPFAADWRWLVGREDSPWYPTMRLFRQARPGAWGEVFERLAREMRNLLAGGAPPFPRQHLLKS